MILINSAYSGVCGEYFFTGNPGSAVIFRAKIDLKSRFGDKPGIFATRDGSVDVTSPDILRFIRHLQEQKLAFKLLRKVAHDVVPEVRNRRWWAELHPQAASSEL